MKITLNKIMIAIMATLLITNVHLYQSRNNALTKVGQVNELLISANRTIDDVVNRSNANVKELTDIQDRNNALLVRLQQLQMDKDDVNQSSETNIIEVVRYAEQNKTSVVNSRIPDDSIKHLRLSKQTN